MTVNPVLEVEQHLLQKPENLFIPLTGGNTFFTLDLKEAYQKVLFEEDSCKFLNINTHQGLYRYIRVHLALHQHQKCFRK